MANFFEQFHQEEEQPENFFSQFHSQETIPQPTPLQMPEPGSYTQDDLVSNDSLYNPVRDFMVLRYGSQAIDGLERSEIVDRFLNNRRGVSSGNSVRGLSELDFLNEISEDSEAVAATGKAYNIYENMANVFSGQTTLAEKAEGVMDFTRSVLADPINLVSFGVGKLAAGGGVRIATQAAKKEAIKAMAREAAKQNATKKTIQAAGEKAMANAVSNIGKQEAIRQTNAAATREAMKGMGLRKLAQTSALREIAATTAFDAVVSTGLEYGYQNGLIRTGVQEDVNKYALGLAFLGGTIIGGIQAGAVLKRGEVDMAMPSITAKPPETKDVNVLAELTESLRKYSENLVPQQLSWKGAVQKGSSFNQVDTNLFIDMLIGLGDKDTGEVYLKGIAQIAYENGMLYKKRFDEDTYSNWVKDLIRASDPQDVKEFAKAWRKATGVQIKGLSKMSVDDLANTFAYKINQSARVLNAASQGSKLNGISDVDYQIQQFVNDALDLGLATPDAPRTVADKVGELVPSVVSESVSGIQNRIIRTLVSHPSTSYLNLVGWGVQTTLGSAADVGGAILHAGTGTLKKAAGMLDEGADPLRVSRMILQANANRVKLGLNPSLTHDAYKSLLELRGEEVKGLADVIAGGVIDTSKVLANSSLSPSAQMLGAKTDEVIDLVQLLTLVKGQDAFTKSQEFVYQLDKNLRVAFDKSWDEFFTQPDAAKFINTKAYREVEQKALQTTLERISSKSYKGTGLTGEIASIIEDSRNIPGLGLLVPFGRFFNNTVDFTIQNTPMAPHVAKLLGGYYKDKTYSELWARSTISSVALYTLAQTEYENRKQGLAIDQVVDPLTGEVRSIQYDYPLSQYKYAGYIASYWFNGETVPEEVVARVNRDIGLGAFTRNLDTTANDIMTIVQQGISGEQEALIRAMEQTGSAIGSQLISGVTRPLEPANFMLGFVSGSEGKLVDRKIGSQFLNKSLRYLDNVTLLLTGEEQPQAVGAATGPMYIQTSKMVGARPVRLTSTERVMNIMGIPTYKLNAPTAVTDKAPEAANKYNQYMHLSIEDEASKLLDQGFADMKPEKQKLLWKEMTRRQRDIAKTMMFLDNSGVTDTADLMFELSDKYSWKKIDEAVDSMSQKLGEELKFEDLTRGQLYALKTWLETRDTLIMLDD